MSDHHTKEPVPLVNISVVTKLEEDIESHVHEIRNGKIWFSDEIKKEHKRLKSSLAGYIFHSRIMAVVTAPFIYGVIIPFALLDLFVTVYQMVCFPVYGIPKVRRRDYIAIDRGHLRYLNALERLNCLYCSYGNGTLAYVVEIAGRTEQHWCPIKHARRMQNTHHRYSHFLPYGNAQAYRENIETIRNDFKRS